MHWLLPVLLNVTRIPSVLLRPHQHCGDPSALLPAVQTMHSCAFHPFVYQPPFIGSAHSALSLAVAFLCQPTSNDSILAVPSFAVPSFAVPFFAVPSRLYIGHEGLSTFQCTKACTEALSTFQCTESSISSSLTAIYLMLQC